MTVAVLSDFKTDQLWTSAGVSRQQAITKLNKSRQTTRCPEKGATLFSTITLAILGRYLQFFYRWKRERIPHDSL